MHCFIQSQSFDIRPIEYACALVRHPLRIQESLKRYITRGCRGFDFLEQLVQRKADPGDYHGPPFNTTQSIDPFLERKLQQLIEIENPWFVDQSFYSNSPRPRNKTFGGISHSAFRRVKLIEVV